MILVAAFVLIPFAGMFLIPFLKVNRKGIVTFALLMINALLSGYFAIQSLQGKMLEFLLPGSFVTG